jgi:hypothetical protein
VTIGNGRTVHYLFSVRNMFYIMLIIIIDHMPVFSRSRVCSIGLCELEQKPMKTMRIIRLGCASRLIDSDPGLPTSQVTKNWHARSTAEEPRLLAEKYRFLPGPPRPARDRTPRPPPFVTQPEHDASAFRQTREIQILLSSQGTGLPASGYAV